MDRGSRSAAHIWRHDAYTLRQLAKAVSRTLNKLQTQYDDATALDFGSGDAPYESEIKNAGYKYLSADISGKPDVVVTSGKPLPIETETISLVASFQVLEHVWDVEWYLAESRRILKKDGHLLLSTHGTWLYHPHPTDFRRWTKSGLAMELETQGFKIVSIEPLIGPLAWTTQFRTLALHHVLSKIPIIGKGLSSVFNSLGYIKMTLEDKITPYQHRLDNASIYLIVAKP